MADLFLILICTYVWYLVLEIIGSVLGLDQHTLASARNVPKTVVITLCECSIETMGPWDIIVGLQGCISLLG
jgi:hypothetical protein